jgi:Fe-S cluster assembly ATPase SufC
MSTLEIKNLHVSISTEQGPVEILKGVDLTLNQGETHLLFGSGWETSKRQCHLSRWNLDLPSAT